MNTPTSVSHCKTVELFQDLAVTLDGEDLQILLEIQSRFNQLRLAFAHALSFGIPSVPGFVRSAEAAMQNANAALKRSE